MKGEKTWLLYIVATVRILIPKAASLIAVVPDVLTRINQFHLIAVKTAITLKVGKKDNN